jgi:hypothetical protein
MMREMMRRRDPIFWAATGIFVLSLVLAKLIDDGFLFLMVGAYLLRPTLHSLGFAKKLVDERQLQIQYRASNVGFAALVIGNIVVVLYLMGQQDHAWELVNAVLLIGLAVRALTGLLMVGDLSAAGPRILFAVGLFLCLFGIIEGGGLSLDSLAHGIPGLVVIGIGLAARRWPKAIAGILLVFVAFIAAWFVNRALRGSSPVGWGEVVTLLLIATPLVVAAICLLRARPDTDDGTPARAAPVALLALSIGALALSPASAQTKPLACKPWGTKPSLGTVCTLAHDDTVFGRRMPAGTVLHYDTAGVMNFVWFRQNTIFEGLELRGTGDGPHQTFRPDGTPKMLWLARTQEVQGVPCRPISLWTELVGGTSAVYFHPSGRLRACRLGRAATIQGVAFLKGDHIEMGDGGKIVVGKR